MTQQHAPEGPYGSICLQACFTFFLFLLMPVSALKAGSLLTPGQPYHPSGGQRRTRRRSFGSQPLSEDCSWVRSSLAGLLSSRLLPRLWARLTAGGRAVLNGCVKTFFYTSQQETASMAEL